MEKNIIKAPQGTNYLSDIMSELPVNCLFNKGKTGCGGTELVLRGTKNAIIAVPYISLIQNKLDANSEHGDRRDEILGFYGEVDETEVRAYLSTHSLKKIIVTYDSLPKLVRIIGEVEGDGEKGFNDYFLLVDEWHCLFKYYAFRNEAIRNMLPVAKKFKEVTYMTATPVDPEYTLEELKDLPVTEVQWEDKTNLDVEICESNIPIGAFFKFVAKINNLYPMVNFHVFLNSVSMITSLLKELNFHSDNVKIVCSQNNDKSNLKKLQEVNPDYVIAQPDSPAKKLNLYTSTAFEGCDIHDPNGLNIIISAAYKEQTMLDITTTVPQICGRIRDSRFKNKLFYFYSPRQKNEVSLDTYKKQSLKEFKEEQDFILDLNNLQPRHRDRVIQLVLYKKGCNSNIPYLYKDEEGNLRLDKNYLMFELYKFHVTNEVFTSLSNIKAEFEKNGNIVLKYNLQPLTRVASEKLQENVKAKVSYKDLFEEYYSIRQNVVSLELFVDPSGKMNLQENSARTIIEQERPFVKQAYEELGIDTIRTLEYNRQKIEKELIRRQNIPNEMKVMQLFKQKITFGKQYSVKELNEILQKISNDYSLPKLPASKIDTYFMCENTSPKINGTTTKCKTIIKEKIMLLD